MAGIMNGIASTNFFKIFSGTFLSFADYMKPSLRLAALMQIDPILVFTHDSIGLGEDGPTHQPIEQINMLRSIPNGNVFRPADLFETALCWEAAINIKNGPSFLCLSRQNLPQISNKIANTKEPIKASTPVIFETFKSKPYPRSHIRCLNSFNMWKLKVQQRLTAINFPKKVFKKKFIG